MVGYDSPNRAQFDFQKKMASIPDRRADCVAGAFTANWSSGQRDLITERRARAAGPMAFSFAAESAFGSANGQQNQQLTGDLGADEVHLYSTNRLRRPSNECSIRDGGDNFRLGSKPGKRWLFCFAAEPRRRESLRSLASKACHSTISRAQQLAEIKPLD